jgi:hypothetical protein
MGTAASLVNKEELQDLAEGTVCRTILALHAQEICRQSVL